MLMHRLTSSALAHGLKAAVIGSAGLAILLVRSDDPGDVWGTLVVEAAAFAVFFGVFLLVFTALWLWRRSASPVPPDARRGSFADALRPEWPDLPLLGLVLCLASVASMDFAILVVAFGLGTGPATAAQAILVRGWERRLDTVYFWTRDWSWRFPPLYGVSRD